MNHQRIYPVLTVLALVLSGALCLAGEADKKESGPKAGASRNVPAKAPGYWVALDGSDRNKGTETRPLATLAAAVEKAKPGDTIRLKPGTYHQRVIIRKSGEKGAPITIEGSRGPKGEWLSLLDGGEPTVSADWVPDPEVGPNVYRNDSLPFVPGQVAIDGLSIPRLNAKAGMKRQYTAMEILGWPEDRREARAVESGRSAPVWKTIGGVYHPAERDGKPVVWLRLAEGRDPRKGAITVSPEGGAVVALENASHIIIRDLAVADGETGILINGSEAKDNLVDTCSIRHGKTKVHITAAASGNVVRGSYLFLGSVSGNTGAWGSRGVQLDAAELDAAGAREFVYLFFKYFASAASISADKAILIDEGATGNTVENNELDGGVIGVQAENTSNLLVRNNRIRNFSSVGTVARDGSLDVTYENNFFENCNINIRLHELNVGKGHRVYLYGNRSLLPHGLGTHIHSHSAKDPDKGHPDAQIFIYHNTFEGGAVGLSLPDPALLDHGAPGYRVVDNIFTGCQCPVRAKLPIHGDPAMMGIFDYNLVAGGVIPHGIPAWFGKNNIVSEEAVPLTDFSLPADSPARKAGLDLSRPFEIDGKNYEPWPGMRPGYARDERPNMGALQN